MASPAGGVGHRTHDRRTGGKEPRFPPDKEGIARAAITATLRELDLGAGDLAICSGACGADLLFAEAALECGADVELYLPFPEERFMEELVDFAGPAWGRRFRAVRDHPRTRMVVMPPDLPATQPTEDDPYVRTNLRMLAFALALGPERVWLVALWDGRGGDGPGGTEHMVRVVRERGGQVYHLDTTQLWESAKP